MRLNDRVRRLEGAALKRWVRGLSDEELLALLADAEASARARGLRSPRQVEDAEDNARLVTGILQQARNMGITFVADDTDQRPRR